MSLPISTLKPTSAAIETSKGKIDILNKSRTLFPPWKCLKSNYVSGDRRLEVLLVTSNMR